MGADGQFGVKGVGVILTRQYVRSRFSPRYEEWLASLSPSSRDIVETAISGTWYPIEAALIEPMQQACRLFHEGREDGAWQMGRHAADHALRGVYSVFMKNGRPGFVISRSKSVFSYHYQPCEIQIVENSPGRAIMQVVRPPVVSRLLELRMGGWMQRALEMTGASPVTVQIAQSVALGDEVTELVMEWAELPSPAQAIGASGNSP